MKLTLDKKILIALAICSALLLGVGIASVRNSEKWVTTTSWVAHTHQVLYELGQVLQYAEDAETAERGYIISGEADYLDPFDGDKAAIRQHIRSIQQLTEDNPAQQDNIRTLSELTGDHMAHLDRCIGIRKAQGFDAAARMLANAEGKKRLDRIRRQVALSMRLENELLATREKASKEDAQNFMQVFILLLVIIVLVLIAVYIIISTNLKALRRAEQENEDKNWNLTGTSELARQMQGNKLTQDLSQHIIDYVCKYLEADIGAIYLTDADGAHLTLSAGYAVDSHTLAQKRVCWGEGLVGQAAAGNTMIILSDIPVGYFHVESSIGAIRPREIIAAAFPLDERVLGVIEIGKVAGFSAIARKFLPLVINNVAIGIDAAQARAKAKELMDQTLQQAEELQAQQEELRQMNEELEEQSQNLRQQQEELQMTNEELEEQTQILEAKNAEVEAARADIQQKSRQLEISSRYKSEFLANMSHELRTPLNSLLILSRDLADNKKKNLTQDQVESAEIINKSGMDLLGLINEVLDLSKIEAGKMTLELERLELKSFADDIGRNFRHQAESKGLKLSLTLGETLPGYIITDTKRLDQIMRNLLSNAIKFTAHGVIGVDIQRRDSGHVSIAVSDTGIGIPADKQMAVFEAFHQGDGSTSRKYGGTGLGLSISRELSRLLGGEIRLESTVGEGTTFTLILPVELKAERVAGDGSKDITVSRPAQVFEKNEHLYNYPTIKDDRGDVKEGDTLVLIIEDDLKFAEILLRQSHTKGFKCIAAATGEDGLVLAAQYRPHAIILDIDLPGIDGHQVLAQLKHDPDTRHIPVHIMSVNERTLGPIKEGAVEFLTKPIQKRDLEEAFNRIENLVNRKVKNLLIVEDDANARIAMKKLIGNGDVKTYEAKDGAEALDMYTAHHIDCIVLDLGLPDMSGIDLIHSLQKTREPLPPIIIYTGKELTRAENDELQKYAESIIIKGVKSEERLLDETALFLHRTISLLPEAKQKIITGLYDRESLFHNKKILLVDDDMRNVFALSKVLRERGLEVARAENGQIALDMLAADPDVHLVLMDIMMPEMDGYEAMRRIRAQERFRTLPIIALTAKAMKEDKQKCIDAGANDYITKPVDVERLLSLMRVWLSK
ncbi:MAG: response regulator [Bacteroidetes bacterium]|nr:response regulator [Bacteroidota bacterium]